MFLSSRTSKRSVSRSSCSAGAGHRKELEIPEAALSHEPAESHLQASTSAEGEFPDVDPTPLADRSPRVSLKDVLIGVGFLLALAAFVLSLKNARHLTKLKETKSTE